MNFLLGSAEMMKNNPFIDENLLIELLVRLPASSLIRFKRVSKSWFQIISNHSFIMKHFAFTSSINSDRLLLIEPAGYPGSEQSGVLSIYHPASEMHYVNASQVISLPVSIFPGGIRILGVSNGLICFHRPVFHVFGSGDFFLCNPATKKTSKLPPHCLTIKHTVGRGSFMNCDTFAFDSRSRDFKLLRFWHYEVSGNNPLPPVDRVHIYSEIADSWRVIDTDLECRLDHFESSIEMKGVLHWRGARISDYRNVIACFDLTDEVFKVLELPRSDEVIKVIESTTFYDYTKVAWHPMVIHNSLGIFVYGEGYVDVWMMKEYGVYESWAKLARVPQFMENISNCICGANGNVVVGSCQEEHNIFALDAKTRMFKTLVTSKISGIVYVYSFWETLVPIRGGRAVLAPDVASPLDDLPASWD